MINRRVGEIADMKIIPPLVLLILLSFVGKLLPQASIPTVTAKNVSDSSLRDTDALTERIKRIENGLLPQAVIKGAPPVHMKLADRMRYYNAPGLSIAVINRGKIEWVRSYGVKEAGKNEPVTPETVFAAGSVSKPVAAMAALHFAEQSKLELDEDVNHKLVSWKVPENEYTEQEKVTLRRLLNHSAGLPLFDSAGYRDGESFPTIVQALNGVKPAIGQPVRVEFVPGSRWQYSSAGYGILQLLLMDVTGKPFSEVMRETVFDQLGMSHSTYEQPLPKQFWNLAATGHSSINGEPVPGRWRATPAAAAGGLWTTPTDLARFIIELQESKAGKSWKVISPEMAKLNAHATNCEVESGT